MIADERRNLGRVGKIETLPILQICPLSSQTIGDIYDFQFSLVGKIWDGRETKKSQTFWDFPDIWKPGLKATLSLLRVSKGLTVSRETSSKVNCWAWKWRKDNRWPWKKLKAYSVIFFISGIGSISKYSETPEHSTPFYLLCSTLTRPERQDKAWKTRQGLAKVSRLNKTKMYIVMTNDLFYLICLLRLY